MPVEHDTATVNTGSSVTALTTPLTVGSHSDRAVVVGVAWSDLSLSGSSLDTVNYAGAPMTFIGMTLSGGTSELYVGTGPPVGGSVCDLVWGGVFPDPPLVSVVAGLESLYNVNQVDPIGATGADAGNGATVAAIVSPQRPGSVVVDSLAVAASPSPAANPNYPQVERWDNSAPAGASRIKGAGSTRDTLSAAGIVMGWQLGAVVPFASVAGEILEAIYGGSPTQLLAGGR